MNPSRTPFRAESIGWMGVEDEGEPLTAYPSKPGAVRMQRTFFSLSLKKVCFWVVTVFLHAIRLWTLVHDCYYFPVIE